MIVKVIDASAAAALVFAEDGAEGVAARLEGARLVAPNLLPHELANVCWKKCRRAPQLRHELLYALANWRGLGVGLLLTDPSPVVELALTSGLSAYDASYLWLARRLDAELITLDRRLDAAARS